MRQLLLATLIALCTHSLAISETADARVAAGRTNLEQELKRLLQEMTDARWGLNEKAAAQRKAVAERTLADTYVQVFENGDALTKAEILEGRSSENSATVAKNAAETQFTVTIQDLRAHAFGDAATATYVMNMRLVFNGEPVVKLFRCTETFVRRDGRWRSVLHTETVMPGEPRAAKVENKAWNDYVGQYRLTPSIVYTVGREGDKLVWGRNRRELVPENENTFLFRRSPGRKTDLNTSYRIIFVRDDKGRVTHLRMREFPGVEYSAIKVQ